MFATISLYDRGVTSTIGCLFWTLTLSHDALGMGESCCRANSCWGADTDTASDVGDADSDAALDVCDTDSDAAVDICTEPGGGASACSGAGTSMGDSGGGGGGR
jgi:hypothetical protein